MRRSDRVLLKLSKYRKGGELAQSPYRYLLDNPRISKMGLLSMGKLLGRELKEIQVGEIDS